MVILDLLEAMGVLAEGMTTRVPIGSFHDHELVQTWCHQSGNSLVGTGDGWVEVQRGRRRELSPELERRLEARLWLYTNFDCNLACDYCCVRSSPTAPRRALGLPTIRRLVDEALVASVSEIFLTGGEPFILPEIGEIAAACAAALPTTLLTNGMLFSGQRLETLKAMPRDNFALQISLDSPGPGPHDRHRGRGSWERACSGIATARGLGFRVRVAATLTDGRTPEVEMRTFLNDMGIPTEDQVLRPVARQGSAQAGVVVSPDSLIPEVTVTAAGVFWHPVGADDEGMLVTRQLFPLNEAIATVRARFAEQVAKSEVIAQSFTCA